MGLVKKLSEFLLSSVCHEEEISISRLKRMTKVTGLVQSGKATIDLGGKVQ